MTDNGGFTIGGVAASTYGITLMYGPNQPMLPETKDRTVDVLGRVGSLFIDSNPGSKSFSLPCQFRDCETAAELDTLIRTFARVLVDERGRSKQIKLIFDDYPDWYYLVRYSGQIPFDRKWVGCTDFTIDLISDMPYAQRITETITSEDITTDPQTWNLVCTGTTETPAKICITNSGAATVSGIKITHTYEVD